MNKNLVISTKTILITIGLVALSILLYQIRDVLLQLLVALIISLAIEPVVKYLVRSKFPRWAAVSLVFAITVFVLVLFFTLVLPLVVEQTRKLLVNIPDFVQKIFGDEAVRTSLNASLSQFAIGSGSVFLVTYNVFSNVLGLITVFIFTLYLSLDLPNVKKRFLNLFADDLVDYVEEAIHDVEINLSHWIKGQLILMLAVGSVSYLGLIAVRMPYALSLALMAGILEVVPVLGPIISTVVASIVAFAISPVLGIIVVALFVGIQQLENSFLVPKVMQKVTGFNPLVTMAALLIGGKLFGVVGAIISIPVALMVIVIAHKLITLDLES